MKKMDEVKQNGFSVLPITTEHLILRPGRLSDFESVNQYALKEQVYRYIRPPEGDERTHRMLESMAKPWFLVEGQWHGLIITYSAEDRAIGDIVFRVDDEATRRIELGYRLSPENSGKGIISEAAAAVVDMLFRELDIVKIVARCDPRNIPSYQIMEKLGMKREAEFKSHYLNGDELTDQFDYGLLRKDWQTN
ncbi:MAG: GNAT family N-acetyltransferase [Kangiellaceae bacterium]|nr:GNAT family N-acetyltransferase [Kangiellaceae bacterium]